MKKYREIKYDCGEFLDVEFFPVYKKSKSRRARYKPTTEGQALLNHKRAQRKLIRLVHTNFCERDYAVHLTYTEGNMPRDKESAQRELQNYIRRLKRIYAKAGIEFKYIYVTEQGKKSMRLHHHLIVSGGVSRDVLESAWKLGRANTRRLQFDNNGVAGLMAYISKQALFYRRWNRSKNLREPTVRVNDYRVSRKKAHSVCVFEDKKTIAELYPLYDMAHIEYTVAEISAEYYAFLRLKKRM